MIPPLNEIVGLPPATSPAEVGRATESRFHAVLDRAARGDLQAQRDLVALRVAYLNWAYASPRLPSGAATPNEFPAIAGIHKGSLAPVSPRRWS